MSLWAYDGKYSRTSWAREELGLDVYLCGAGPSLSGVQQSLQGTGRLIFGICDSYPKVRPDIWIGMDEPKCYDAQVWNEAFPKLVRHGLVPDSVKSGYNVFMPDLEKADPCEMFNRTDKFVRFVWAKNTLTTALHIIYWMGGRRVMLLGCDFGGARDYWHDMVLTDKQRAYSRASYRQQVEMLQRLHACDKFEFWSCTPDSPMNEFIPYISTQDAIRRTEEKYSKPKVERVHVLA